MWGLFWRLLLVILGNLVVIPAPWTSTMLYRYFAENTWLPSGRRLMFAGKAGDIWYVFILLAVLGLLGQMRPLALLITLPLSFMLNYLVFRWLCDKVGSEDGSLKLAFTGSFWGYLGWSLLMLVSIGDDHRLGLGAQVLPAMDMPKHQRHAQFRLRRDRAGASCGEPSCSVLASVFLIPIPWVLRWYIGLAPQPGARGDLATHFD